VTGRSPIAGNTAGAWAAPGAHPVADGVHRVVLPMPQDGLRAVNVYVLAGPDGLSLIDAGWRVPGNLALLDDGLRQLGHRLEDVRDVYVTHVHRDHYTLGPALRRAVGARIHLGAAERPGLQLVRELGSNVPTSSLRELARAGASDLAAAMVELLADEPWDASDWEEPDSWLEPGRVTLGGRAMEAVAVPGHTKGHLVFHDPVAALLFTGDHVLPTITPSIGFELGDWDLPLEQYLDSLRALEARPDAIVLPAHGMPGGSVHERVRELLAHHERRFAATLAAVSGPAGPDGKPGLDVASRLTWTRRERPFDTLDPFNRMIAVCETMAHLDVLVARGLLQVTTSDGVDLFAPA
jgi:glyoxylase-like metal-dependent hydrolase (beta-lactamase superfamily II)